MLSGTVMIGYGECGIPGLVSNQCALKPMLYSFNVALGTGLSSFSGLPYKTEVVTLYWPHRILCSESNEIWGMK